MSAASGRIWKLNHPEKARDWNRDYMRLMRLARRPTWFDIHMVAAYAERFHTSIRAVRRIGTLQLSLCKSDEARRILLKAAEADSAAGKVANAAMNAKRRAA